MNKRISLSLLTFITLSSTVFSKQLEQNLHVGFVNTSGNTDTLNLNGRYDANTTTTGVNNQALSIVFNASAFETENNNVRDNEEYTANIMLEQIIMDNWLAYTNVSWLKNKFLNFDHKTAFGAGFGKELYKDTLQSFKLKLGLAYNWENYTNTQTNYNFTSLNQHFEYNNKLNEISNFFVNVTALENFDNFKNDYEVLGSLGVKFSVAERVNVVLSQEIRYENLPSLGFKKTDTKSIVTVGYHF